ncbi:hypothetical protein MRB53_013300 [Persea americana]|uniref:Uncharacterized protein n=1 Tax=Persea americana TaxID=3435 RepID=A0ACC2K830_PERAE|nr:hypothetical protein MRB53_013300 [Persea americana]
MSSPPFISTGSGGTTNTPVADAIKQANSSFQWVTAAAIISSIVGAIALVAIVYAIIRCLRKTGDAIQIKKNVDGNSLVISIPSAFPVIPDSQVEMATMERFLNDMAREKPIRFSAQQLVNFTRNYATRLGSVTSIVGAIAFVATVYAIITCLSKTGDAIKQHVDGYSLVSSIPSASPVILDSQVEMATMERFLNDMAREKPIRFSPQQLENFTRNYTTRLGSGLGIWNSGSSDHSTETARTAFESSYKDSTPIMRKYEKEIANSVQKQ